jgi:hypothetical protein
MYLLSLDLKKIENFFNFAEMIQRNLSLGQSQQQKFYLDQCFNVNLRMSFKLF